MKRLTILGSILVMIVVPCGVALGDDPPPDQTGAVALEYESGSESLNQFEGGGTPTCTLYVEGRDFPNAQGGSLAGAGHLECNLTMRLVSIRICLDFLWPWGWEVAVTCAPTSPDFTNAGDTSIVYSQPLGTQCYRGETWRFHVYGRATDYGGTSYYNHTWGYPPLNC